MPANTNNKATAPVQWQALSQVLWKELACAHSGHTTLLLAYKDLSIFFIFFLPTGTMVGTLHGDLGVAHICSERGKMSP